MRILAVGDVHGNDKFFAAAVKEAKKEECDVIVQLGDFGYWEHYPEGKSFLKWCERQLKEKEIDCYWLDGNHENHPLLWETYGNDPTKVSQVRERLFYMPRGYRWTWDNTTFMAMGGAYSIDVAYRTPGKSWWATETISDEEVKTALGGPVDILFSHDCPEGVAIPCLSRQSTTIFPESRANREQLIRICEAVTPKMIVHGHYHERYNTVWLPHTYRSAPVPVIGVGCDGDWEDGWVVVDTAIVP